LDTDDLERMLVEIECGHPPSLVSPEADAMRARLVEACDAIHAKGGSVLIPHEIPSLDREPRMAGGSGSGNFGHAGRPGEVGGSAEGGDGWQSSGGFAHTGITWKQPTDKNGRPIPVKVKTVNEAARLVLQGIVVEVKDVKTARTLIDKLAVAARAGKDFDMCNVTVAGTNMFCGDNLGFPRVEMPQLKGLPVPGSQADKLKTNDAGEVNGADKFLAYLEGVGVKTHEETVKSSSLSASQREMVGAKVVAILAKMEETRADKKADNPRDKPIWISRDNAIVDGHHNWAASVAKDAADGKLGDSKMHVIRLDLPISEALHLANAWSKKFGIQQKSAVVKQAKATGLHK